MARPEMITDDLIQRFCTTITISGSIETAILRTGIGRTTYYRWVRMVREGQATPKQQKFIAEVDKAEGAVKAYREQMFTKHSNKNWRTIAAWLARTYPEEYGRHRTSPLEDQDTPECKIDRPVRIPRKKAGARSSGRKRTRQTPNLSKPKA